MIREGWAPEEHYQRLEDALAAAGIGSLAEATPLDELDITEWNPPNRLPPDDGLLSWKNEGEGAGKAYVGDELVDWMTREEAKKLARERGLAFEEL